MGAISNGKEDSRLYYAIFLSLKGLVINVRSGNGVSTETRQTRQTRQQDNKTGTEAKLLQILETLKTRKQKFVNTKKFN